MVLKDDPNHYDLTTKLLYLEQIKSNAVDARFVYNRWKDTIRILTPLPTSMKLDDPCKSSLECLLFVQHSFCDWDDRICSCQPYHIRYNDTACLPASLLGFGCAVDEQCTLKVPHSECINGLCQCQPNHVPLRRDKCLPPATVGDYCLNNVQCHLSSPFSYCKYIIPRIYGKCQCPYGYLVTEDDKCLPCE
ncbi:uncharacterized protein LOC111632479 [Centruroides sculpturatus]|uniref:uncharacterized protein LOC111632479 n=1 Tax=Centruroides sculpturatus TaxID=218467 RepID=UPI000C6E6155|nr:uncharacterized protein LOC111632479 [Centruroides sculpturatus]